ncbi:MAG: hypothetical protein WCG66_00720 [bacterium]
MKYTFTNNLKTLMLGGALAVSAASQAQAVTVCAEVSTITKRVEKIRQAAADASVMPSSVTSGSADVMWWRNAWGNGGWHNWHNGWRNGGGWHNWLNI